MLEKERIPTPEGLGRILAEPVFACFSSPNFHAAAMDGIALKAEDTFGTTIDRPRQFQMGREAFWINTGQPMPAGTNAVVMVEQVFQMKESEGGTPGGGYLAYVPRWAGPGGHRLLCLRASHHGL
jgi:putative molybdopterin biosynthesis protein